MLVSLLSQDQSNADAQADLSLHWAHMQFCWFCHEAAIQTTVLGCVSRLVPFDCKIRYRSEKLNLEQKNRMRNQYSEHFLKQHHFTQFKSFTVVFYHIDIHN